MKEEFLEKKIEDETFKFLEKDCGLIAARIAYPCEVGRFVERIRNFSIEPAEEEEVEDLRCNVAELEDLLEDKENELYGLSRKVLKGIDEALKLMDDLEYKKAGEKLKELKNIAEEW